MRKGKKFYSLSESYSYYTKAYPESLTYKEYSVIVQKFLVFCFEKLLLTGKITLPERLGSIEIIGREVSPKIEGGVIKGLAPDWVQTRQLWNTNERAKEEKKILYHFNEDQSGLRYRFKWCKERVLLPNKTLYYLQFTRKNKRALSKVIKEGGKEYRIMV